MNLSLADHTLQDRVKLSLSYLGIKILLVGHNLSTVPFYFLDMQHESEYHYFKGNFEAEIPQ